MLTNFPLKSVNFGHRNPRKPTWDLTVTKKPPDETMEQMRWRPASPYDQDQTIHYKWPSKDDAWAISVPASLRMTKNSTLTMRIGYNCLHPLDKACIAHQTSDQPTNIDVQVRLLSLHCGCWKSTVRSANRSIKSNWLLEVYL